MSGLSARLAVCLAGWLSFVVGATVFVMSVGVVSVFVVGVVGVLVVVVVSVVSVVRVVSVLAFSLSQKTLLNIQRVASYNS